ncbi:unnamed protein product [Adineta steineri]|uniref:Uncharacterized protein n=1 Tax=Adineta steineri TaxID=433720 RepID=A0A818QZC0_9BILA|nr:unnamed protein product [Adineta steineri]CAF3641807.1 unnamed protein product [Adineta steineri]
MFHHKDHSKHNITLDIPDTPYSKSYAIVVSSTTLNDNNWNSVVSFLFDRHSDATLLVYSNNDVKTIHSDLKAAMPRYVAFVCQPDECGRTFVAKCHRLMRTLDNDPYVDAMWAIITGSDAESAIKSIDNESIPQPFIIRRAINFTNVDQNLFESCFTFSDAKRNCWSGKNCGLDDGSGEEKDEGDEYPKAPAEIFAEKLNEMEPDLLVTSGHGGEQYVEMPWSVGKLQVEESGLVPLDENSEPAAPIIESSNNPKIFLPIANCLVGHCNGSQCMVTTFLGRMGVRQMCGYTVRTWFGRAGWGTLDLWKSVPGRLTLSDAYFLHQARMTYDIKSINPRLLDFKFEFSDDPDYETVANQLEKQYHLNHEKIDDKVREEIYGLCYDHDTFVFYGDPAFIANLQENSTENLLTTKFHRTGKTTHQFIIEYKDVETAQNYKLPIGSIFTNRIEHFNIINGFEYVPILSDNFLMILKPNPRDKESTIIKIDFRGTLI